MSYTLYFGNMNYSSWSLRPWVLLKQFNIPFEPKKVEVAGTGPNAMHRGYSPNGLVPCLHVDGFPIWDTLAIAEFLAERHKGLWPVDAMARARARSVACEMHSGFGAVRSAMPMNIKLRLKGAPLADDVKADVKRIADSWIDCRERFGRGGDFLFGDFSVADAMFAPVIWRFNTFNVDLPRVAALYRDAMLALPAMKEWEAGALAETVAMLHYDAVADAWGGPR